MKPTKKIILTVLACVIVLALAASLTLNGIALAKQSENARSLAAMQSGLNELQSKQDSQFASQSGMQAGLADLGSGLKDMKTDVTDLRSDLDAARAERGALQDSVSALQEGVSGMQTELADLHETFQSLMGQTEDPAQEDDVRIAGQYMIRSTRPISDAYLSGDSSALSDKEKETLDMASKVLEQIITEDMTPYEKEKAVYEWMTQNLQNDEGLLIVIPQTQADCDNPYGVLKYHNAVCVGYATTFRLFMHMLEIPCMVVHNSECYHSWDLIQLDGDWYITDIYSDAGNCNYSHFNMTDSIWGQDQSWNREFFPAAEGYRYCYACMNAVDETDVYHIPAAVRELLDSRGTHLALRFSGSLEEQEAQIGEQMLCNIQSIVDNSGEFSQSYFSWNWIPTGDSYVLSVNVVWYNEEPIDPDLPEEVYEKIFEAVDEAFGDLEQVPYYDDDWQWGGAVG